MSAPEAILLAGRRGLILGGSSEDSVGFQCAREFQRQGARVALTHRRPPGPALRALRDAGCTLVPMDALDEDSVARGVEHAGQRFERLDFVVHTLVHVPHESLARSLLELSAAALAEAMEVGLRSLILACRHAEPWLCKSPTPRVVTLLSAGAELALPNYHLIGIVKAALAASVRYLALELGQKGVLCNAVNFSILETEAARRVIGAERARDTRSYLAKRAMTRRAVEYADVVSAIAFLSSAACRNMTAESLRVDGGFQQSYF